jgi:hypothetical protein
MQMIFGMVFWTGVSVWAALSPRVGFLGIIDQGATLGLLVALGEPFSSESGTAMPFELTQGQPTMQIETRSR